MEGSYTKKRVANKYALDNCNYLFCKIGRLETTRNNECYQNSVKRTKTKGALLPAIMETHISVEQKKSKKKVMFSDKIEYVDSSMKNLELEDINALWWQKHEICMFKASAKVLGKSLAGSASCIAMAYKKIFFMLHSNKDELLKLPLSTPDEDLWQWFAVNDNSRGLEKYSCRQYAMNNSIAVKRSRRVVLWAQQKIQRDSRLRYDPEMIANMSRPYTRSARTFALFVGAADAKDAQQRNTIT